jgi:hypothetical protein
VERKSLRLQIQEAMLEEAYSVTDRYALSKLKALHYSMDVNLASYIVSWSGGCKIGCLQLQYYPMFGWSDRQERTALNIRILLL